MSYSRIILVATLSFWSSASLIGMESWFSWRKKATPENNYYLNEDIQKLMLFKKAKVEDKYGTLVPEDVHNIIVKQGYNHYCSQLFETKTYCPFSIQNLKFEKYWQTRIDTTNNENRTKQFQGKKINVNDFDFITMNEEGRKIFYRVLLTVPRPREDGTMQYVYPTNVITKSFLDMTERERDKLFNPLSPDEYNKALKLPLELRCKIGVLCNVKAIGKELVSSKKKWADAKFWGMLGGLAGAIGGGVLSGDTDALAALALALDTSSSSYLKEQEMKRLKPSTEGLKSVGLGGCCGAALGAIVGFTTASDYNHNKVFTVVEKPLITLKEQEAIKKAEKEAQNKINQQIRAKEHAVFDEQHQIEVKPVEEHRKYIYTAAGKIPYMGKISYKKPTVWTIEASKKNLKNRE